MQRNKSILYYLLSSCVVFFSILPAQLKAVSIKGFDISYANTEISFMRPSDPFTGKEVEVAACIVNSDGSFQLDFELQETSYLFAYLGKYRIYIFAEPHKNYEIVLPARIDKTAADNLNPFFDYIHVHLGLNNPDKDELNMLIRMFNDGFAPYYAKHSDKVFADDIEFKQLDKDIEQLDKPYAKSKNIYFNEYREYKYGLLRYIAYQHKSKSVSDTYFKARPFLENNPAYVELFNMVYEKYFSYFVRTEEGSQLNEAIKNRSYSEVKRVLSADHVLQPVELLDMVLLRSLHSEFYDDNYSRSSMLTVLDSMIVLTENNLVKNTAQSIREKVTQLLVGFDPPGFELYNADSTLISLDDFKGRFVYLNFCSCFSYACLNEFAMLQNIYRKHSKYLEIVTVVIDDDVQVMKDFVSRSGYEWTFLHFDNHPDIFKEYDVRAFPTYYLIDDEGKLSMSPAPAPAEEFEGRLFKALRAKGIL